MPMVKLTRIHGKHKSFYMSASNIEAIRINEDDETIVQCRFGSSSTFVIQETPERVLELLEEAESPNPICLCTHDINLRSELVIPIDNIVYGKFVDNSVSLYLINGDTISLDEPNTIRDELTRLGWSIPTSPFAVETD